MTQAARRRSRRAAPASEIRSVVIARARSSCEWCGSDDAYSWSVHHRQPRGMGGSRATHVNLPSNLMLLCGSGTTGCHGWVESNRSEAVQCGLLVTRPHLPASSPVLYRKVRWVLLGDDGSVVAWVPPEEL